MNTSDFDMIVDADPATAPNAHYYSVPYRFARAEVDARLTARGVGIFHKGERIAVYLRSSGNRKHTTVPEHMPSSHRRYAGWTIERIREDARKIGKATAALCEQILEFRPHPEQGYRVMAQGQAADDTAELVEHWKLVTPDKLFAVRRILSSAVCPGDFGKRSAALSEQRHST